MNNLLSDLTKIEIAGHKTFLGKKLVELRQMWSLPFKSDRLKPGISCILL